VTRRVSYQKQELLTLRDHLGSPPVFVIFLFYFLLQGPCSSSFKFSVFCCDFFILFVIVMCLVCPILLVSLDCPFLIGPSVFSNVYLQPKCDKYCKCFQWSHHARKHDINTYQDQLVLKLILT
jgi:hypothetical protein